MREETIAKVVRLWRRVNHFMREGSVESWINLNLTIPQMKCLIYILRHENQFKRLAAGIHVTSANVTGIIDRLVEQGLVARIQDSADRRVLWLSVTQKGESMLASLKEGKTGRMRELLERLSDKELAIVEQAFDILAGAVDSIKEGDDGNG